MKMKPNKQIVAIEKPDSREAKPLLLVDGEIVRG